MPDSPASRSTHLPRRPASRQLHQAVPLVERAHRVIEHLRRCAPRSCTGAELPAGLGVSVRTIERDIERLTAAGVPIRVRTGPGGGYAIDARRDLPPLTLSPGEAAAVIAALVAIGPEASATAGSALSKLLAALTPEDAATDTAPL